MPFAGLSYKDTERRAQGKPHPDYKRNVERMNRFIDSLEPGNLWDVVQEKDVNVPGGARFVDVIWSLYKNRSLNWKDHFQLRDGESMYRPDEWQERATAVWEKMKKSKDFMRINLHGDYENVDADFLYMKGLFFKKGIATPQKGHKSLRGTNFLESI